MSKHQKPLEFCSICGVKINPDRIDKHVRKVHPEAILEAIFMAVGKSENEIAPGTKLFLKKPQTNKISSTTEKVLRHHPSKVVLESRRGTQINGGYCSECGAYEIPVWQYAKSNCGQVCLCIRCKPFALNRSFKKIDVLDIAISGGAFEMSRRRH